MAGWHETLRYNAGSVMDWRGTLRKRRQRSSLGDKTYTSRGPALPILRGARVRPE